ncbi:MAG: hypothetical protein LBG28_04245 [Tannerella sp.]|jgi:hypothetical protein|nr:hypothetical protein [Tannerella sp.]
MGIIIIYSLFGVILLIKAFFIKKNPYSQVEDSPTLQKMATHETAKRYADQLYKTVLFFGLFYIVAAFVISWFLDALYAWLFFFSGLICFALSIIYCRKIITGNIPFKLMAVITIPFIAIMAILVKGNQEMPVQIEDNHVILAGITIPYHEISNICLADTLPSINVRLNGFSMGGVKKGIFRSKSLGKNIRLSLHSYSPPFFYLQREGKELIILNFRNKDKTMQVYEQLKQIVEEK